MLDCHRLRNRASHRRSDDMSLLDAERIQQSHRVGSHIRQRIGDRRQVPGKHSGLIADYANVFASLEKALAIYGALAIVMFGYLNSYALQLIAYAVPIEEAGAREIARRSRGTPRIANRLLRRVRDFAQVRAQGVITDAVAKDALALLEVDAHGFDEVDRKLMLTIIDKFGGGPVGVGALAAAISEEQDAIEDIYEPFLLQLGFLDRTPRGRTVTRRAYEHFGRVPPAASPQKKLF
jgi:hypothetical protein